MDGPLPLPGESEVAFDGFQIKLPPAAYL